MNLKENLLEGAAAHSFVWKGETYFLHATYQDPSDIVRDYGEFASQQVGPAETLYTCLRNNPRVPNTPVIAAVITRVFDDPLIKADILPGHEASAEAQQELKEFHDQMVEINGINFWRMYYEQMGFKTFVDKMAAHLSNGTETADTLSLEKLLSIVTVGYFLHCIDNNLLEDEVGVMQSSPFDYHFVLHGNPPKEREDVAYFFMWRIS